MAPYCRSINGSLVHIKSVHVSQVAHQARAYLAHPSSGWFLYHEMTGSISSPPGWDASPSQGYPQHLVYQYSFIHLDGESHCESSVSVLSKNSLCKP